jgi:N utilization substance protein A
VDAQGACIGTRGSRIQAIVNELKNEKIDIIRWSDQPEELIVNALAPAKIVRVHAFDDPRMPRALVVVPDDQLSLAIGRDGQNVRLAAKLTGYKLDIKSLSQIEEHGYDFPVPVPMPAAEELGPEATSEEWSGDGTAEALDASASEEAAPESVMVPAGDHEAEVAEADASEEAAPEEDEA